MCEETTIDQKREAAGNLLVKLARDEELSSPELRQILDRLEQELEQQAQLTEEDLNLRAGF